MLTNISLNFKFCFAYLKGAETYLKNFFYSHIFISTRLNFVFTHEFRPIAQFNQSENAGKQKVKYVIQPESKNCIKNVTISFKSNESQLCLFLTYSRNNELLDRFLQREELFQPKDTA